MFALPYLDDTPKYKPITLLNIKFVESCFLAFIWLYSAGSIGKNPNPEFLTILLTSGLITGFLWVAISNRSSDAIEKFTAKLSQWLLSTGLGLVLGWLTFNLYKDFSFTHLFLGAFTYLLLATGYFGMIRGFYKFRTDYISFNSSAKQAVTLTSGIFICYLAHILSSGLIDYVLNIKTI